MKIINAKSKKPSDWAQGIVNASIQKDASLQVNTGKVLCPMTGKTISTINCELCKHCSGIDFKLASSTEHVRCSYSYDTGDKDSAADPMEKFQTSSIQEKVSLDPEAIKSIFAKSKPEDFNEEEGMSERKIVSAKNISEDEFEGSKSFVSEYNNSIFNPKVLAELEGLAQKEASEEIKNKKSASQTESERRSEWMEDRKRELEEIDYEPKTSTRSISNDTESNNPDVGDYKFSMFGDIDEKLGKIPNLTDGEMLKSQKEERKRDISREAKKDGWEKDSKSPKTSSQIVDGYFTSLFDKG